MVFYGEYQVSFTGSGRIVLPKKIRELLKGDIFILTKGFDFCLNGYDREDWERKSSELLQSSLIEKEGMGKKRFIFASTVYLEIDDQGRFVIPHNLIVYTELKDKATIIGTGDHFEIWEPKRWEKYLDQIKS